MFIVNESTVGPELAGYLFSREQLAGPVHEQQKHLEGLGVELDAEPLAAKLPGGSVGFKCSEAIARCWLWAGHVFFPVYATGSRTEAGRAMYNFAEVASMQSFAR